AWSAERWLRWQATISAPIEMQLRLPFVRLFLVHQECPSGLPTGRRDATVDAGRTSVRAAMWAVVAANQSLAPRQSVAAFDAHERIKDVSMRKSLPDQSTDFRGLPGVRPQTVPFRCRSRLSQHHRWPAVARPLAGLRRRRSAAYRTPGPILRGRSHDSPSGAGRDGRAAQRGVRRGGAPTGAMGSGALPPVRIRRNTLRGRAEFAYGRGNRCAKPEVHPRPRSLERTARAGATLYRLCSGPAALRRPAGGTVAVRLHCWIPICQRL